MDQNPTPSRVGGTFGHYQLRSLLGRGGMGEVYEAYDTVKDRTVALKLLSEKLASDSSYQERFRRESQAAARLQEPHVIPIHDWGEIDGVLYINMRLVHGRDLRAVLREDGPLAPARAVVVIGQIASALDSAHAEGLVHRDIKPGNILVTSDDFAYLVDFGIAHSSSDAQLTTQGAAIGSYAYMAPERFDVGPVGGAADTYSLSCVLFEALTGVQPFPHGTASQLIKSHVMSPPPRPSQYPDVPAAFDTVIATGMAKQPRDRYGSAGEFAAAAYAALSQKGQSVAAATLDQTLVGETLPPEGYGEQWLTAQQYPGQQYPGQQYPSQPYAGSPYAGSPYPGPYYSEAPQPAPTSQQSRAVPVVLALLAVLILGLGGTWAYLALFNDPSTPVSSAAKSDRNSRDDSARTTTSAPATGSTNRTTPTQTVTTTVPAPPTRPTTPTTLPNPNRNVGVSGADGQGFLGNSDARCNEENPAVAIARTDKSYVVVCLTGVGRYYYKGVRARDGAAIEIDDPVPTGSGFVATSQGTQYRLTSTALTMTNGGEVLGTEPVLEYYGS